MAKQTINQGTAPTGAGGDTFRTGSAKLQANDNELYNYLGDGVNLNKLGTAAFKNVGTQAGNVMEVGAFGLGAKLASRITGDLNTLNLPTGFYSGSSFSNAPIPTSPDIWGYLIQQNLAAVGAGFYEWQIFGGIDGDMYLRTKLAGRSSQWSRVWTQRNTTLDSNGFIKAASPIVKLFAEKIESNNEAAEQKAVFQKNDIGHYLIKGSLGFAQEGWYIDMPKDANGNVLVAVQYTQLEDNTIEVKTFAKKFNEETGDIVPNLEKPRDIPVGRWIDIRLQELPQPEFVPPVSNTPVSFQPTGISQAVSEMMNGTE